MVAPGEILGGKYEAERVLGHGGMGLVLAARHLHLDQRVAIKLLNQEHLNQPAIVERFLREARASVRLRSEHVARVLDAGRFDDGMPFLVMEYLEGHDLAAELAQVSRLPVALAVELILQACDAVAEAHQAGIVHRDLKPANLFITRDSEGAPLLKVLDFGISKIVDDPASDLTTTKMVMGSPPYMSPEQLRASRSVDVRADVWSLGVVLYELVSGRRPFVGNTLAHLVMQISGEPPDPLGPDGPAALEAVIARCLAKSPADRYASIAELAAALMPFAGPRSAAHLERIRRRTAPPITAPSSPFVLAPADQRTTLSGATGTLEPRAAAPRRVRPAVIGAAFAAVALAAAVVVWLTRPASVPDALERGATLPAVAPSSSVQPGAPSPAPSAPAVGAPAALSVGSAEPAVGAAPAIADAPATTPAAGTGSPAPAAPSSAAASPGAGQAAPAVSSSAAGPAAPGAGSARPRAASSAASKPASRPADPHRVTPPAPSKPVRRPPLPPPSEDLTRSQY